MGKKMTYDLNPIKVNKEAARFDTCVRMSGGFNLNIENVGLKNLPSLAPLHVDFKTRKAVAVKNVKAYAKYTNSSDGTAMKICKGSLAYVGMHIGSGKKGATINAIDKSDANFDKLTLAAQFGEDVNEGAVLFEASAAGGTTQKNKANALNYAVTPVEEGATVTGIASIYEIKRANVEAPISDKDVADLGDRYLFID